MRSFFAVKLELKFAISRMRIESSNFLLISQDSFHTRKTTIMQILQNNPGLTSIDQKCESYNSIN